MSRLTQDGTAAEPVLRYQTLMREQRGQGNMIFSCSADHEQNLQPYPVDLYPAVICDDHTYHAVQDFFSFFHKPNQEYCYSALIVFGPELFTTTYFFLLQAKPHLVSLLPHI